MNDMGPVLRVMIPNGRLYILDATRVVKQLVLENRFYEHNNGLYELVESEDQIVPSGCDVNVFKDNDWEFEEDKFLLPMRLHGNFVKDVAYPRKRRAA